MVILQAVNIQKLLVYLLELLIYIKELSSLAGSKTVSELLKRIACFYDPGHSLSLLNNKTKRSYNSRKQVV